jgi:hypothetical protein
MEIGPVDVVILAFPGNKFHGKIVPELRKLIEGGLIRVLDLMFVYKDDEGNVGSVEMAGLGADLDPQFVEVDVQYAGAILDSDDVSLAGDGLEPGNSAAIIVWENTWAAPFVSALRDADAVVVDQARIPVDVVEAALSATAES